MTEPRKTPRTDAAELWFIRNQPGLDAKRVMSAFDHARALEIETQELAEALKELYNTTASLRFDAKGRHGWKFVAETSAWKLNTVAMVKAEQLALTRHRAKQEASK